MLRWAATAVIGALLVIDLVLPGTSLGRRGSEREIRADIPGAFREIGSPLPDFRLTELDGSEFRLADLRGHRVLLIFERSVDW
ncbi:MAG: hypothetical protein ACE5FL_11840 [Myxococcota bacterium]